MNVREATTSDAEPVSRIYNHNIETSHATFELETIDEVEMETRISSILEQGYPFLVAVEGDTVTGYSYGRAFRPRPGYKHSVEVAVYVHHEYQNRRVATLLYSRLFPELFAAGAHTLIATIALPNEPSVRLHEKLGFEKAGHFREVGRKFDRWIDVGYWQLLAKTDRT